MCIFILKSYNPKKEIRNPHFFILNKGNNSGKTLLSPCPNCFSIQFNCNQDKEQVFWLLFCLWQANAFYPFLRGSVIPFVVLRDMKSFINENWQRAANQPKQFQNMIEFFQAINKVENQLKQNLKAIDKAKRMLLYQFVRQAGKVMDKPTISHT